MRARENTEDNQQNDPDPNRNKLGAEWDEKDPQLAQGLVWQEGSAEAL